MVGIGSRLRRASYALLAFFGLGDPAKTPRFRQSKPKPVPAAHAPAPARNRPKMTPQRVSAWRKARQVEAEAIDNLKRAELLTRRANRPTIRRAAEFRAKADRLLARIEIREGRLTSDCFAEDVRIVRAA